MTTYKIGDLVKVDDRAAFRNDVQLDNFDDPQLNLGLINSYLFSNASQGGRQSPQSLSIAPVGVLDNLVQTFLSDRLDNRSYLIATYGHGKSHLALALANYFSHPYASPEVTTLLEKLSNSLGNRALASRYNDFKKSRGEFLVLRLRGDVPHSLHEQVLRGLEKALSEHPATRNQKLPFWFTEAERIIRGFGKTEQEKGNLFLESAGHDIPLLLQRLSQKEDVHDLCVKLIQHVTGIRPNLGGEVSLAKVIHWATDEFCGAGKPLGGLLILFDEFSLFIQRYAQRNATGELQDLLNGISDRQGKAAFLAFSQLDLMQLADNLQITGNSKEGLKRELTRIPKKWVLFSLMESVVDAYLIQEEKPWQALLADKKVSGALFQATDVAWERFSKRYSAGLQWSFEQYQERVAKGCFPLHPITTYLLCNLKLQSDDTGTPRTVLGFVLEELRTRQEEPAAEGNSPNWVVPIELVDYFEGRLTGDVYTQFAAAQRTVGEDAPQEQRAVLKALLLQFLADVAVRHDDQILFLAHCAGLEERVAKQALRTLSDTNVIRYDHSFKAYTFWPASNQPKVLEEFILKKLERFSWSMNMLDELNKTLKAKKDNYFGSMDVKVDWGNPTDWAAREYIVTADLLNEWLRGITKQFGYNHRDITDADRSIVVWIVANHDDEATTIRETVTEAFQTAFASISQNPPAIVAVISTRPQPELLVAFRRHWALQQFSQKERTDAGKEMFDVETQQADFNLLRALKMIRADDKLPSDIPRPRDVYLVPTAYVSELRLSERIPLRDLLIRLYRVAFAYAPNEFFTQYRVISQGVNKLRDATREVSESLIRNAPSDLKTLARVNRGIVPDLCNKFLVQKWELLTPDYRIQQQPGNRRLREAWQQIDNAIKPGDNDNKLRDALFPLLNPPYGYDYNTALLLFAAWFGYHRLDIEISINGRRVDHSALIGLVGKGSREFFYSIAINEIVSLRRRVMPDVGEVKKRIQDATQKSFQYEIAETELLVLRDIAEDERYNGDIRQGAQQAAQSLAQAIEQAKQYDGDAEQIKTSVARAHTAQELIALQKKIEKLPTASSVQTQKDTPVQLRQQIEARFVTVIEAVCQENESPKQLTEIGLNRTRLMGEKKAVASVGLPVLTQRIETSLARLNQREAELQQALQEEQRLKGLQATIESVDPRGRLQQLQSGRITLQALGNLPGELARQRDSRLQQVEKAIADIHRQIKENRTELNSVKQSDQLRTVRDKLVALQPRCADTDEAIEIATLLEQADKLRVHLEEQVRRHSELKQIIRSVDDQAPLRQLIAGADELRALTDLPSDLTRLRDERLKAIDKRITAVRAQIEQAQRELAAARTVTQLSKLRTGLYELNSLCKETAEADKVAQLLTNLSNTHDRLAQQEQHTADIRRIINAADPKSNLKRLVEARAQLTELADLPTELISTRNGRLQEIEQAITDVRIQIDRAKAALTTTRDPQVIKLTRDTLLRLQSRCVETAEEAEITELIQQTTQLQAELEEEVRCHNEWRATIKAVNPNHKRLRLLHEGRSTLQALSSLPPSLSQERDTRLREVEKAIATMEKQVERTVALLDTITDRTQLDKHRDELSALQQRCEETALAEPLLAQLERANILRNFFDQLEREHKPQVDVLANSHAQAKRIQQIAQDFDAHLSPQQKQVVADQQERLQKAVQELRIKARNWLTKQENALERKDDLTELDIRLASPPPEWALVTATQQQSLVTLRQQVRQLIDADALTAIENRFRQISERHLQEQCLQTLQQILQDGTQ